MAYIPKDSEANFAIALKRSMKIWSLAHQIEGKSNYISVEHAFADNL